MLKDEPAEPWFSLESTVFMTRSDNPPKIESLPPGSFAFVMATGIVAIALDLHGFHEIGEILGAVNWVGYSLLTALTVLRLIFYRAAVAEDFSHHLRGPGFLTLVAGTSVLGAQCVVIEQMQVVATILWYWALGLWIVILYAFLIVMAVDERKPSLGSGINGGWNLLTVATQSIVVLGGLIGARAAPLPAFQFIFLAMFLAGGLLYLMTITLIFYRVSFFEVTPKEFGPLYWIDMGGAAISVLAGATLLQRADTWPILHHYAPFLAGATVCFWAAGTFWIPFLFGMLGWRYLVRKDAFIYEVGLWGMVFPLGMYATSTFELARAENLEFLEPLSVIFAFVGFAAWLVTGGALLMSMPSYLRRSSHS
jgi:tellurite resistance protein TehA-like permease